MYGRTKALLTSGVCAGISTLAGAAFAQSSMPEGAGRDLVEAVCTGCHNTGQITRSSGYSRPDWDALTASMIDLSAAPKQHAAILDYLATNFPPNDRRTPTLVDGPVEIALTEWMVPTLGQRSRDPVEASDGLIWWTGQWADLIGSIDPATGEMTEYRLPQGSRAHSVNVGPDGMIWYTGNGNGTVGYVDPATGDVTVFEMPDANALDPHTAIFDQDGIYWFTLQRSNMVGRLDPETGDIRLVTMPSSGSRPYGIVVDADGTLWVACNGHNCLVRVDPDTMALTEIELPIPDTTVRRLDVADDGTIWYGNASQGMLGQYDPATGAITEWPSPSGPRSHPYGLAVVDGIVWYNESGMRPDALVRFDPSTETFQSWAVPSGTFYAGIVRHMRPTADGDLLIHQSSTNRIMRVHVETPSQ